MSIYIEKETEKEFDFNYKETIEMVVFEALDYIECPYEVELCVTITDNEEIHKINKEHRGIDRPTDVLSFPMIEYDVPGDFGILDNEVEEYFNPETGELLLGDIVISIDKVYSQAEEYGHSRRRELAFLVAHSMLHLFGFDHEEEEERKEMESMQKEILDSVGILRD